MADSWFISYLTAKKRETINDQAVRNQETDNRGAAARKRN
jgi:hypothetical protein